MTKKQHYVPQFYLIVVVETLILCYSVLYRLATRMDDVNELYYFGFRMESGG